MIFKRWWNASNNYNSLSKNANRSTSCYYCIFLCHTSLWRVHVDIWEKTNKNHSSVGKLVMKFQIGFPNKCSKNTICTFRMFKNEFILNENDWKMYSSLMQLEEEILICWPFGIWNLIKQYHWHPPNSHFVLLVLLSPLYSRWMFLWFFSLTSVSTLQNSRGKGHGSFWKQSYII